MSKLISGVGSFTSTLAVAVLPAPPFVEVTVTVLVLTPIVLPVTWSVIVHVTPAAKLTPLKLTVDEPAVAVADPPQPLDRPFGVATTRPLGSVSVNATPVSAAEIFGLLIESVNVMLLPVRMELAPKDLAMTGGATTVSDDVP